MCRRPRSPAVHCVCRWPARLQLLRWRRCSDLRLLGFMEHVETCIRAEYDLAANWLPWESKEGGWLWSRVWDTYDLLVDHLQIGFVREGGDALVSAMTDCLGDDHWCESDPYSADPLETLRLRWRQFSDLIKHGTRFFLDRWTPPSSHRSFSSRPPPTPAEMLSAIGDRIQRMDLFRTLPAGQTVYRARYFEGDGFLRTPQELGPPPPERAVVSNRMSPPGNHHVLRRPRFPDGPPRDCDRAGPIRRRQIQRPPSLRLLDLTNLPAVPGFFAEIPDSQPWGSMTRSSSGSWSMT